jgi:hypothetical protein
MHGNGSRWSRVTVPGQAGADLIQVAATSPGNVWAVGEAGTTSPSGPYSLAMYRWNGSAWTAVSMPHPR